MLNIVCYVHNTISLLPFPHQMANLIVVIRKSWNNECFNSWWSLCWVHAISEQKPVDKLNLKAQGDTA